ncbi:leucyl aminopeptidase family protein [Allokutzneria albata]|uniref:Probable cytosol aminopeptidase n=1 Tax=Allokutzneria albata TaxID=211114 RepID=A0A1G9YJ40_ALLAB|nr:M17 family metallopeptidase [Allokutzneria albata]SDN09117.1 leucyl aminopeptidase [Allokutzneria albata]
MPPVSPSVPTPLPRVSVTTKVRRDGLRALIAAAGPELRSGTLDVDLLGALAATGAAAEVNPLPLTKGPGWLVGVGDGTPRDWRAAGAALVRAATARARALDEAPRPVQVALPGDLEPDLAGEFALGATLGGHELKVTGERPHRVKAVELLSDSPAVAEAVARAVTLAEATALARDLAGTPSNIKNPAWLAETARRTCAALDVKVRDEAWLAKHGFGGVLAVGGGSASPPRLVELSWNPAAAKKDTPHLVLVGKGITFDTGGISIKPAEGMHLMRTDMSGGAAVIAALRGIAALDLPIRVTGLVPCAENHVSGSAYRPGDVVRHYGGTTTEVTNTDAEGRMVLADALAYAVHKHAPDVIVDVATLTGAMKVALGLRTGGVFATSPELAERITTAGADAGETWWEMPLLEAHAADVRSEIADLRQCPPGPGGVTAALFLREFAAGLPWAHLDIAGPARAEKAYDEVNPGGTGFAARTLINLAASYLP